MHLEAQAMPDPMEEPITQAGGDDDLPSSGIDRSGCRPCAHSGDGRVVCA